MPQFTDTVLTCILRRLLVEQGYSNPEPYEWHQGEVLYYGEPLQGRITPQEATAASLTFGALIGSANGTLVTRSMGDVTIWDLDTGRVAEQEKPSGTQSGSNPEDAGQIAGSNPATST